MRTGEASSCVEGAQASSVSRRKRRGPLQALADMSAVEHTAKVSWSKMDRRSIGKGCVGGLLVHVHKLNTRRTEGPQSRHFPPQDRSDTSRPRRQRFFALSLCIMCHTLDAAVR